MAGSILSQEKSSARPLRAALYARVSTLNNGQSPEMQIRDFTEYCQRRGWTATEYVDVGVSGAKDRRPELDRLMVEAHQRRFDVVVVWKFDRFARSVSHLLRALETFNSLGIAFVSLGEQIDTSTPAGRMIFTVLGAVAELERSLIAERVRAGMRNARAKGKSIGRPPRTQLSSRGPQINCRGLLVSEGQLPPARKEIRYFYWDCSAVRADVPEGSLRPPRNSLIRCSSTTESEANGIALGPAVLSSLHCIRERKTNSKPIRGLVTQNRAQHSFPGGAPLFFRGHLAPTNLSNSARTQIGHWV